MPTIASPGSLSASSMNPSRASECRTEGFVDFDGQAMYAIGDYDLMPPFLMSLISDADLWMYLSSNGGLTAGRVEPSRCLFPYETEDKLHTCHTFTGPCTALRVRRGGAEHGETILWRPFVERRTDTTQRRIHKNVSGTQVIFEETRNDLGLRLRYRWTPTNALGFVRTVWLENLDTASPVHVEVLDGLLNILPAGVELATVQRFSSLLNAYAQSEVDAQTGLGIFSLTSKIMDRAEPGESLAANVVWSTGLDEPVVTTDATAVEAFCQGHDVEARPLLRNRRGCYLLRSTFTLAPGATKQWHVVTDADRTQTQVVALRKLLIETPDLQRAIDDAIAVTTQRLGANVAAADGLQLTGDSRASAHHFANALFNNMRGGVFAEGYRIDLADFADFIAVRNKDAAKRLKPLFAAWLDKTQSIDYIALRQLTDASGNADLIRLSLEYLPLTFGRRHGDPSRPWNMFAIRVQRPDGGRVYDYQGNWRDIFQNWEALARSFPAYLPGMIAKFVNASTPDGFNPYRVSREGIDWEVPDPHDPWSHIGYWGDHQIVYLLKLLEQARDHDPQTLRQMLTQRLFAFANVPYRLKSYAEILADPKHSIDFDLKAHRRALDEVKRLGSDGRLLLDGEGNVIHVTLAEKLLIPLLGKLSNLVVGGGVWMNTQRPEWNDANNALAGRGLSVVTVAHMLRYARLVRQLLVESAKETGDGGLEMSGHVVDWLHALTGVLRSCRATGDASELNGAARKKVLDELGQAYENHRTRLSENGLGLPVMLARADAVALLDEAVAICESTLKANARGDGLYHAYNLLTLDDAGTKAGIDRLPLMLEGQVAVLSSGLLTPGEAARLLEALFASDLYRADIKTFILYPWRDLPRYLDRNIAPAQEVQKVPLLRELLRRNDASIIERDAEGNHRFSSAFINADDLAAALKRLAGDAALASLVTSDTAAVLRLYEVTFHHAAFTGRSGAMYGYEGLGCVYWHMVAKLLLAAQECCFAAASDAQGGASLKALIAFYYRIRAGLGFEKTAAEFGAFPLDPYSHTPGDRGAQQPGMTGQVKEEILTRAGELGLRVADGQLRFDPLLLREGEFLETPANWSYVDLAGRPQTLELAAGSLALTCCQTPVVLRRAEKPGMKLIGGDGGVTEVVGLALDHAASADIFHRGGQVARIEVDLPRK